MSKMFITEGEGNQQTLSDIQSEKIPIYDSQQDAESDLANLAEGQLVATKDNGNNNHYLLQSEYNSNNTYSTSEVDTGKTWIDGKKIYRKVTEFITPATPSFISFATLGLPVDISLIITLDGWIAGSDTNTNWTHRLNSFQSAEYTAFCDYDMRQKLLFIQLGTEQYLKNKPAVLIVEYTKTSD